MAISGINISAPICSTSYGLVSQNIVKALIKKGIDVSLRPIGPLEPDKDCGYQDYINRCNPNFIRNAPHLIIWHQFALKKFLQPHASMNVGFPIFELDNFDTREQENLNACDALVTCSKWGVDILRQFCPTKPLGVVPLGVDRNIIFPLQTQPHDKVRFCQISKWEVRKGQLNVMKAFAEVFAGIEDVELNMVCHNDFIGEDNEKWNQLGYKICGGKLNIVKERFHSHTRVNQFLNDQDVGVFPSLAEGWNLSAAECIALNKIVIATDYSGHTEFLNNNNSLLIPIDNFELAFDSRWFFGNQGRWAIFGDSQYTLLKQHMLTAYHEIKAKKIINNRNSFLAQFSWSNSIDKLLEFLDG